MEGETTLPILEGAQESETDQQRKAKEARIKETMRVYEHAEEKRLAEEKRKFGGMRRYEAYKIVRSILYLALGVEGKKIFAQKHPRVKILGISFKKFFELLEAAFIKPTNMTFERDKLLSSKQKDRESYEQFWGALSDLARSCEIGINAEQEWIGDVIIFNLKNCDLQRRLLSETLNPVDALNQAIIDEKGYNNHLKLTNMTRSFNTTGSSGRVFKNFNNVKKEPSLNIERSNTCLKCGNAFTKGHLNVCPAKEIVCNICKYKGHFGRLCKSKGRKLAVNTVEETANSQNCSHSPEDLQARSEENLCGVINAWTEEGISDNDDCSVLNIRTIYDTNGLETKKLVNIGLGDDAIVNLNIPVDSASPVRFLKQNVLHELKLRNPQLKVHPVDKKTSELCCGFTNDTININRKVVMRIQSNGWTADEFPFFITSGHVRNILGNDNLPRIGIEIAQRQPLLPVNNITLHICVS